MTEGRRKNVFILGSGFSRNLGLPLQCEFTRELLNVGDRPLSGPTMKKVTDFVKFAFHPESGNATNWPDLEDIFTCIDMSANTGHNLGRQYTPKELRTVRRLLISRIIRVLNDGYVQAKRKQGKNWQVFKRFINAIEPTRDAFVVMNWDAIVESGLADLKGMISFSYGCQAVPVSLPYKRKFPVELQPDSATPISIVKMHGSINWLYCDNCRRVYYVLPKEIYKVANQIVSTDEWAEILVTNERVQQLSKRFGCNQCKSSELTTRLATFSYLKALNSSMMQQSWQAAEMALRDATRWVFIGYSLPSADYEFKYLLKRVQLSRVCQPSIFLITGETGAAYTKEKYQRFFGDKFKEGENFFKSGLNDDVISSILL